MARLLILLMLIGVPARAGAEVVSILELRFDQVPPALAADVRQRLHDVLSSLGYRVVNERETAKRLAGSGLPPGCTVGQCLARVRDQVSADRVLVGGIASQGSSYDLVLTLVETGSGSPLAQVTDRCDVCNFKEVESAVAKAAERLHRKALVFLTRHAVLRVTSTPPAASVLLDGVPAGTTPVERVVAPGEHVVTVAAPKHGPSKRRLVLEPGRSQEIHVRLLPGIGGRRAHGSASSREHQVAPWLRWSMLGTGVILGGVGGGLIALDGREMSNPRYVHDTRSAGITLVSLGAAAAVTATLLTIIETAGEDSRERADRGNEDWAATGGANAGH
jgi:hypothetical protein